MRVIRMATEKQIHFAEKLSQEKSHPLPQGYINLSTKAMSDLIDDLLKLNTSITGRFIVQHPKLVPFPKLTVTAGFYCLDGEVVKVQLNLAGTKHYAKRLVQDGDKWVFTYEAGLINKLTPTMKLEREQAAAFGKIYGYCCICATRLTNEDSIDKGIGPVCDGKQDW